MVYQTELELATGRQVYHGYVRFAKPATARKLRSMFTTTGTVRVAVAYCTGEEARRVCSDPLKAVPDTGVHQYNVMLDASTDEAE